MGLCAGAEFASLTGEVVSWVNPYCVGRAALGGRLGDLSILLVLATISHLDTSVMVEVVLRTG